MRLLDLRRRSWWNLTEPQAPFLRLLLLRALGVRARGIALRRDGDLAEIAFRHDDRIEPHPPLPAHLADEFADEVRGLAGWRHSFDDWADRRRRCCVLSEREGTARLLLGGPDALLHFWVLPYCDGVFVELTLVARPGAAEQARAIAVAEEDLLEEQAS
jgi:hypothetical protein